MRTDPTTAALELLHTGLNPRWHRAEAPILRPLARTAGRQIGRGAGTAAPEDAAVIVIEVVAEALIEAARTLVQLHEAYQAFTRKVAVAETPQRTQAQLLAFAEALGTSRWRAAGDARATRRWLEVDAMVDRYRDQVAATEWAVLIMLRRIGAVAARALAGRADPVAAALWRRLDLETVVARFLDHDGDRRVNAAAFTALAEAIAALPAGQRSDSLREPSVRAIYRFAQDRARSVWVQRSALGTLRLLSRERFRTIVADRLARPGDGDDLFVRRHCVALVAEGLADDPGLAALAPGLPDDPSPHVRQAAAALLVRLAPETAWPVIDRLLGADPVPAVRAAMIRALIEVSDRPGWTDGVAGRLAGVLRTDRDRFVLRTALDATSLGQARLIETAPAAAPAWDASVIPAIAALHAAAPALAVRRWAAEARERLWCGAAPAARALRDALTPLVHDLPDGRCRRVPRRLLAGCSEREIGRVLAVMAQGDFGLELRRGFLGPVIQRGDRFGFRLWRFLHELRTPATDKRQGFSHVIGRIYWGRVIAPPTGLAEHSETKVPGEPLVMAAEDGWRPYLPLPDHVLSAIDSGGTTRLFTAEGVTEITAPRGWPRRLAARLRLSFGYARLARLRNHRDEAGTAAGGYLAALARLDLAVRLRPHDDDAGLDPAVARYFPAVLPIGWDDLWPRFESYVFSVYQNTLTDLVVFLAAISAWFFGNHVAANRSLRAARRRLPLVIGGWGTRGKSGTERLKAALVNALGYGVVSKTTGCEAMFVFARPMRDLREVPLFRPYDKATIWEQAQVVRLAHRLGAQVFLWECMGLNPAYVDILQRQWMTDDIATITNTYPDHEDIQGPAGRNIPEVMVNFLPRRSLVLTSEEQMRPILADGARRLDTALTGVGWRQIGLLAPDVLARFPYEEHPANIALVVALAAELGIDRDIALKEMADRVVPDLGVLKTYPEARSRGRRVVFVNGMSANERFGTLANWTRMRFDEANSLTDPGVRIATVVNNRADREPRSRVFAGILANDVAADLHLLIGSNLDGLRGFLHAAWAERMTTASLWPADDPRSPRQVLADWADWLRVPHTADQVTARLAASLAGLGMAAEAVAGPDGALNPTLADDALAARLDAEGCAATADVVAAFARDRDRWQAFSAFAARLDETDPATRAALDAELVRLLTDWFFARVVSIDDVHTPGDEINAALIGHAVPGVVTRVMGLQNIKGTGLDFVYRWQTWARCYAACADAVAAEPARGAAGLRNLSAFQGYGPLGTETVRATLDEVRGRPWAQSELAQAQVSVIDGTLARAGTRAADGKVEAGTRTSWLARRATALVTWIERFLDAGDAVGRRRIANRLYRDLAAQRISGERVVAELQALNKRQRGGWLARRLATRRAATGR